MAGLGTSFPAVGLNIAVMFVTVSALAILVAYPIVKNVFRTARENRIHTGMVRFRFLVFSMEIRWGSSSKEDVASENVKKEEKPLCRIELYLLYCV